MNLPVGLVLGDRVGSTEGWSVGCTVIEMATGKAPWNEFTNPITAMVTIGTLGFRVWCIAVGGSCHVQ